MTAVRLVRRRWVGGSVAAGLAWVAACRQASAQVPEPHDVTWPTESTRPLVGLAAGVRGWPTTGGAARGGALGMQARHATRWFRARVDAAVAGRGQAGAGGPQLLDGRVVLGTAPLRVGPVGADLTAGVERDAYDPRAAWAQRGAQIRAWLGPPAHGVWLGAGATAPLGPRATPSATELRLGGWARRGRAALGFTVRGVATTRLQAVDPYDADSVSVINASCFVQYDAMRAVRQAQTVCPHRLGSADALLGLRWVWGATTLQARVGHRMAARTASAGGPRTWAGAGLTLPPVGPLALALDYTRQPRDVVRDVPAAGRFFAGLRWVARPRRAAVPAAEANPSVILTADPPAAGADSAAGPAPAGARPAALRSHTVAFALGPATRAELRGDCTGWQPVPLARGTDGWWRAQLALAPGVYAVAVRTDGGAWQAPPGLPSRGDDFGGQVGVLVVQDGSAAARAPVHP